MRLIDADLFVKEVAKHFTQPNYHPDADAFMAMETEQHNDYIQGFIEDIESQLTVIDTSEVVKQLEDRLEEILYDRCYNSDYQLGMMDIRKLLEEVFKIEK